MSDAVTGDLVDSILALLLADTIVFVSVCITLSTSIDGTHYPWWTLPLFFEYLCFGAGLLPARLTLAKSAIMTRKRRRNFILDVRNVRWFFERSV